MSDWENVPANIDDFQGFVYEITNLETGKKYIGKKFYFRTERKPPLKKSGKKRDRIRRVQTDWRDYFGSSKELQEDLKKYGKESFSRVILFNGVSKFDCAYMEIKLQIEKEVLFKDEYLNGIINCRLRNPGKRVKR